MECMRVVIVTVDAPEDVAFWLPLHRPRWSVPLPLPCNTTTLGESHNLLTKQNTQPWVHVSVAERVDQRRDKRNAQKYRNFNSNFLPLPSLGGGAHYVCWRHKSAFAFSMWRPLWQTCPENSSPEECKNSEHTYRLHSKQRISRPLCISHLICTQEKLWSRTNKPHMRIYLGTINCCTCVRDSFPLTPWFEVFLCFLFVKT